MRHLVILASLGVFLLAKAEGCQHATVRGAGGKQLTLVVPGDFVIQRGTTGTLQVGVKREKFTDAVRVSIAKLPQGVSARDASQTVQTDAATFVLEANKDAALVTNQSVDVTAEGPDGMTVTEHVKLTVKE